MSVNSYLLLLTLCFSSFCYAGQEIDKKIEVSSPEIIYLENLRGDIEVKGWNKNIISISGELDDSASKLIIKDKGHKVLIKVKMDGNHHSGDGSDLKLFIPNNSALKFKGVDTSFILKNLPAGIEGRSIKGDITVHNVQNKIKTKTVSGDIKITHSAGEIELESTNGSVSLTGEYEHAFIKSMSGDIYADINDITSLNTENVSGETVIKGVLNEKAQVKLASVSGDIAFKTKGELNAACELKSQFGGKISNAITQDKAKTSVMKQQKLKFVSGNGSGKLMIKTVTGAVSIED